MFFNLMDTKRSRACICSGFVVGVPGLNPAWKVFSEYVFRELDGELS